MIKKWNRTKSYHDNKIYEPVQKVFKLKEQIKDNGMTITRTIEESEENISEIINSLKIMVDYKQALQNLQNPNQPNTGFTDIDVTLLQQLAEDHCPTKALDEYANYIKEQSDIAYGKIKPILPDINSPTELLKAIKENTKKTDAITDKEKEKEQNNK